MTELIHDVIHDTVFMLPFLYVTYLAMEYLEHKSTQRLRNWMLCAKSFGPLIGALVGVVPQCGFSVLATGLYINGGLSLGTLLAVFISTSDEAIPILLSQPNQAFHLGWIIVIKVMIAIFTGYIIDLLIHTRRIQQKHTIQDCHQHCDEELKKHTSIFIIALFHTLKIFAFIFIVNFILSATIHGFGEDALSRLLIHGSIVQPLLAAFVGFIPNCASSVLLTQLFVDGILSFGSLCAGLITNAGLGLLVLMKMYDNKRDILRIVTLLFGIACISGIILQMCFS